MSFFKVTTFNVLVGIVQSIKRDNNDDGEGYGRASPQNTTTTTTKQQRGGGEVF